MSDHLPEPPSKSAERRAANWPRRWKMLAAAAAIGVGIYAYQMRGDDTDRLLRHIGYVGAGGVTDPHGFETPIESHIECGTPQFVGPATDPGTFAVPERPSFSKRLLPRVLAGYTTDAAGEVGGDPRLIIRRVVSILGLPRYAFSGNNLGCHTGLVLIYGDRDMPAVPAEYRNINQTYKFGCDHVGLVLLVEPSFSQARKSTVELSDNWSLCNVDK
jgi:hypothetical protein